MIRTRRYGQRKGVGEVVIEASVVTGYVVAWAVRKAQRLAGVLDKKFDDTLEAGLDRLHDVVANKLSGHPALEDLTEEAASADSQVTELTRQQIELAITAAARRDEDFGQTVTMLLAEMQSIERTAKVSVVGSAGSRIFSGDTQVGAWGTGIAMGPVGGNVYIADASRVQPDPSQPGRSRH